MKNAFTVIAAAAAILAGAASAHSAPVVFNASSESQARGVVNVVFAEYLSERVGVTVETAVLDLDNDNTGEIMVRFVHTGSCVDAMKKCRTAVIRHERPNGWRIVLDRMAVAVDFVPHDRMVPGLLSIDGIDWKWGRRRYEPDGSALGAAVAFKDVPQASVQSFAAAFGAGAQKISSGGHDVRLKFSDDKVAEDETLVVKMEGKAACGELSGCPVRILRKNGDTWGTVLSTSTKGGVAITDTVRAGYRDVVVKTELGYAVLGWNGSAYAVADRIEAIKE